jgi:hypothetical protein
MSDELNLHMMWINNEIGRYRFRKFGFFAGIFVIINFPSFSTPPQIKLYRKRRQPTARVPSVARGTIFHGALTELK